MTDVIETMEARDALPVGSIVWDGGTGVARLCAPGQWACTGYSAVGPLHLSWLPVTVLHDPSSPNVTAAWGERSAWQCEDCEQPITHAQERASEVEYLSPSSSGEDAEPTAARHKSCPDVPAATETITPAERAYYDTANPAGFHNAPDVPTAGLRVTREGVTMIAAERQRQIDIEGYTAEHDARHGEELARAAASYALAGRRRLLHPAEPRPPEWPWLTSYWKPTPGDRVRELVKAGALIAAAIDSELALGVTVVDGEASDRG